MKKIFYTKEISKNGRVRYVPVSEYDSDYIDSFPKGNHLIMSYPGGSTRRYNIDADYAAMIAAGRVAEDPICRAIVKASELRPTKEPLTDGQIRAWKRLKQEFGDDMFGLRGVSVHDCVEAGIKAMQEEADKLMTNPTVRKAYDHFMLVAKLSKEEKNDNH